MRAFNTASASALMALACTAAVVVPPPGHQHNNSIVIGSQASPAQPAKDRAASVGLPAVTKPMKEPPASAGRLPRRGRQLSCTCVDVPGFPCYTTHNDKLNCWSFTDKESCESTGGEYCGSTSITSEVCGTPFRSSGDMILNMLLPVQLVAKCWNNWPLVIIELMTLALEIAILVDLIRCGTKCTLCCGDYADWVRDDPAAATTTVVTAFGIGIGLAGTGVGALGTTAPSSSFRATCALLLQNQPWRAVSLRSSPVSPHLTPVPPSPIPLPPIGQDSTSICAECAHWAHIDVTRPLECGAQMLVLERTPQTRHGPFWLSAEILS